MRLVAFEQHGRACLGVRLGAEVVVLDRLSAEIPGDTVPSDMPSLLALGSDYLAHLAERASSAPATARVPLDGLALLPPVPRPGKVICVGLNYAAHAAEGGNAVPDYPSIFLRGPTSLVGHGRPMLRPRASHRLDYEGELAVVIGRAARHVREDRALDHVAGYACFDEGSVRDYQRRTTQWTVGKNFDATGGFGPELVTADEVPPGARGLRLVTRLNGRVMQDTSIDGMIFGVARLVSILSEVMTLEPGDVIATGTPSGVGYARVPPVFLAPGDVVEVEVEGVGVLSNPVRDEPGATHASALPAVAGAEA